MRWICFCLLGLNVALLIWGAVFSSDTGVVERKAVSKIDGVAQLQLLSDVDGALEGSLVSSVGGSDGGQGAAVEDLPVEGATDNSVMGDDGKQLCEMVGPFENVSAAKDFVGRLRAIEVQSAVEELELPSGIGFWVYLEPEINRESALRRLGELQSRGVDSYVIPKGDLENGISLGMFSKKELADGRISEMKRLGLSPNVKEIERS